MVEEQLKERGIADERVLKIMGEITREEFVPPDKRELAYYDGPLPIGNKQTISQPCVVALMTEALGLDGSGEVLEVGTGSGYQAAILSKLAKQVFTVEKLPELASRAAVVLERLGCRNVVTRVGDGSAGWPEEAPFDGIIVTAAAPEIPTTLISQLAEGGRLVVPVGSQFTQRLFKVTRIDGEVSQEDLGGVRFVPLVGECGWEK